MYTAAKTSRFLIDLSSSGEFADSERAVSHVVVMVTGIGEVTEEAKAAGADEVLIRPVNVSALIWAVNKHVS